MNNPSGRVLSNRRRRYLVVDRAYEELTHATAAETPVAASTFDELGLVYEVAPC